MHLSEPQVSSVCTLAIIEIQLLVVNLGVYTQGIPLIPVGVVSPITLVVGGRQRELQACAVSREHRMRSREQNMRTLMKSLNDKDFEQEIDVYPFKN
jgi:hypothetical protein